MKVRMDVILEFEDGIDDEKLEDRIATIYDTMWDNAIDLDIINEEKMY